MMSNPSERFFWSSTRITRVKKSEITSEAFNESGQSSKNKFVLQKTSMGKEVASRNFFKHHCHVFQMRTELRRYSREMVDIEIKANR